MSSITGTVPGKPLNVLVCGANGFIGRHAVAALVNAGHRVTCASLWRSDASLPHLPVDFSADTSVALWRQRVAGFDTVVNAVGVLRDSARRPMRRVHDEVPAALFAACEQAGVRRIVHLSALGIDEIAGGPARDSLYASSKRSAERALCALDPAKLSWIALRPSLVVGHGSDATLLFRRMAHLPWLPLPAAVLDARIQPLHVCELAVAIATLARPDHPDRGVVSFGGARVLSIAQWIDTVRLGSLGPRYRPARVWRLPAWCSHASARLGDLLPLLPWCSQTREMLERDSIADASPLRRWLGHPLLEPSQMPVGPILEMHHAHAH